MGLVGIAVAGTFVLRILLPGRMDPTIFLALGKQAPIQTEYARELLGDVTPRTLGGHDGKYFFAQANDPWHLDPYTHAAVLDRPIYRGQRMLFPMLAGGFGLFPPHVVVWAMLVTNLLAIGVGSLFAARLAVHRGASPWLGLAVPLNIGLIFEVYVGGAGIVAYVLCLGAVSFLEEDRSWAAAALLAGAALSREVMLVFAAGVFVLFWISERRAWWRFVTVPVVAMAFWHLYLRYRLAGVTGVGGGPQIFAVPFTGMWQAFRQWGRQPDDLLLNGAMLLVVVAFTLRAVRGRLPLAWGALPFVALASVLSMYVWLEPFDLARAFAPVLTAAAFVLFVRETEQAPGLASGRSVGRHGRSTGVAGRRDPTSAGD